MPEQKVSNTVTILYFAFISSTLLYLILGFILYKSGWTPILNDRTLHFVLAILFLAISGTLLTLIVRLKAKAFSDDALRKNQEKNFSKYVVSRTVPLFALSEVPGILGLVYFFLTGNLLVLVAFCVLSLIAFSLAKPGTESLDHLESRFGR